MSFETKYKHTFKDFNDQSWEFHLKKDGYAGAEYTLNGGASPIKILDPNQGMNKFVPIRGTQLTANLWINTAGAYNFKTDFWGITDREWQAVLYKAAGSKYLGECEITNLSISAGSTDATGSITITNTGGIATQPVCIVSFEIADVVQVGTVNMNIYAVPSSDDVNSPSRILLDNVSVLSTDDTEDVVDKIAALGANWEKVDAATFSYQQIVYNGSINSSWNIKLEFTARPLYYLAASTNFNGGTAKQWIAVDLFSKRINSPFALSTRLHLYEFVPGETTTSIATAIAAGLDGDIVQNVYYPTTGEAIDVEIGATSVGAVITITLVGIGTKGNYFNINTGITNDTFIRVSARQDSTYTWTDVDFSGGADGGDEFLIEVDKGAGNVTLASTLAYVGDTDAEIISRLVTIINNTSGVFEASIDLIVDSKLKISTDSAVGWTFKFSTTGASTVTPSTDTAFSTSSVNEIRFIGWVIPGIYQQDHQSGTVAVELQALDGLGDLKNFTFEANDKKPFEKLTLIDIISFALEKTGFNLRIHESFDLWHLEADSSISPLAQTWQDSSRLNGVNCYTVLSELAELLKGYICQRNGKWELIPIDQQGANYDYRIFDYLGNFIESATRSGFIKDTGGTTRDNIMMRRSGKINFEAGFRKVKIKQDYGFISQLLKFPSFITINENLNNIEYPWNWVLGGVTQESYIEDVYKSSDGYLHITNNSAHSTSQFYLQQNVIISDVTLFDEESNQYEYLLTYKSTVNGPITFDVKAYITNKAGTVVMYLQQDAENPLSASPVTISLSSRGADYIETLSIKFDYPDTADFIDEPSIFTTEIYQPTTSYILIKTNQLNINTISATGKRVTNTYSELVDNLSGVVFEKTLMLGDVPNLSNAMSIYKNGLYYYDSNDELQLTSSWVEDPDSPTDQKPLIDHLREFYISSYPLSIVSLNAEILGDLELRDIIKDKSNSDKLLMLSGGEVDIKKTIITGEWLEIGTDVSGYTLTEEVETFEEDSSGSNTYTINGGSSEETEVDLNNYFTKDEVNTKIIGYAGSFTGADLVAKQITISHNLAIDTVILYLYDNNNNMLNQSNFEIDTAGDINSLTLTVHMPVSGGDVFKFRIL